MEQKGCFALAWQELRESDGWLGKCLLLALITFVPILNFIVYGFALKWARDAATGGSAPVPGEIFAEGAFKTGFFAFVIMLLFAIAEFLVSIPLNLIPIIGNLAYLVLTVFVTMFVMLCLMRMVLFDELGEGFSLGAVWQAFTANLSALFCAAWLPSFVFGLVAALASLVLAVPGMFLLLAGISSGDATIALGVVLCVLATYIAVVICMAGVLVSCRATGHYVIRNAPWFE